ncbi:uncharacterized protein isoform X2 [Choristoneura fumiferana]|uniref:uncharacterized protein isoform X2 n=1 Tax=Choristoneura fumiferana TaxID=7141 RepID=UPI003D15C3CF
MVIMVKRWYRSRRNAVCFGIVLTLFALYYICLNNHLPTEPELDITRRSTVLEYIENKLKEALKLDKGMGCEIPVLDPFAKEVTQFDKVLPKIKCLGKDWVKCYHANCRLVDEIKETHKHIKCSYRDILYQSDLKYVIGPVWESPDGSYELKASDHAKVTCKGVRISDDSRQEWSGNVIGFRSTVSPKQPPPGREDSFNVLIFGFDTTARNGFIRRMPKSWKVLNEELGAVVMEGYNIVGDGTPAALFPMLTGKTELELPDVRKSRRNNGTMDTFPFIFYKLKEDGYRTAYFEDSPAIGTFQYRFNGFANQPADHYLRAFYLEESASVKWWKTKKGQYCVGDTPQFKLMMNITEQFLELDGKRFIFTFIADITHDDFNMIQSADDDTAALLRNLQRYSENTLVVVMGDHGPRYAKVRNTLQGKLEERLPLLAILLPKALTRARPNAETSLRENARVLTTPHDLYATLLDVLDMTQYANPYKVEGADLRRGLSMLEPIPRNRSCSEAGIEPHWCSCLAWQNVSTTDPLYEKTAKAFINYINKLVKEVGSKCIPRTLTSTEWVLRQRPNSRLLEFSNAKDSDGYIGHFGAKTKIANENYQIKIVVGPGRGVYEASMTYVVSEDRFIINTRDISRTNAYRNEPDCISDTHPHLNSYCYCQR